MAHATNHTTFSEKTSVAPNTSDDENSSLGGSPPGVHLLLATQLLFTFFGIWGNSCVVASFIAFKWIRTSTNRIILSLAVSDITFCIVALPGVLSVALDVQTSHVCIVTSVVSMVSANVSGLHVLAINLDRYIAISRPLRYSSIVSDSRMRNAILALWLLGLILALPFIVIGSVEYYSNGECFWRSLRLQLGRALFLYLLPFFATVVIYILIFRMAAAKIKQERTMLFTTHSNVTSDVTYVGPTGRQHHQQPADDTSRMAQRKQNKLLKAVALILITYGFCWGSYFIGAVVRSVQELDGTMARLSSFGSSGIFLSTALNPVIYTLFTADFKKAFKQMFKCCHRNRIQSI